jgi:hypothetical protein
MRRRWRLILVVTLGGTTMLARIGVMRALNRQVECVFDASRKADHWGWRKLALRAWLVVLLASRW